MIRDVIILFGWVLVICQVFMRSFSPYGRPYHELAIIFIPFDRWWNEGLRRSNKWPRMTQLVNSQSIPSLLKCWEVFSAFHPLLPWAGTWWTITQTCPDLLVNLTLLFSEVKSSENIRLELSQIFYHLGPYLFKTHSLVKQLGWTGK